MKVRPIIFNREEVVATLDGRKTQFRRLIDAQPVYANSLGVAFDADGWPVDYRNCPFGQQGERLRVKETWQVASCDNGPVVLYRADGDRWQPPYTGEDYGAGPSFDYDRYPTKNWARGYWAADVEEAGPWEPPTRMPLWAIRITLEIVSVRVERLQDITAEDALAEGSYLDRCPCMPRKKDKTPLDTMFRQTGCRDHGKEFRHLWESINGPGAWDSNPWVWAVEYRRVGGGSQA